MSFSDIDAAMKMRNIITSIATDTINKVRPEERIGRVFSIDMQTQTAQILLPGETVENLVAARFALDKVPTSYMALGWNTLGMDAPGDIVRISGKPEAFYIIDFISGSPAINPSVSTVISDTAGAFGEGLEVVNIALDAVEVDLNNLNTVLLPALEADIDAAQFDIDQLNAVTIPALQVDIADNQADINTLIITTIPNLQDDIDTANAELAERVSVLFQTTQPTATSIDRIIWYDTDNGYAASYWNGTAWGPYQYSGAAILPGGIVTTHMAANTINGDRITANTLNASKIVAGSITTDRMTANTINGDRVTTNTLDAGRIVAGSIATDRMTANTINGDRVTANTLNASKIVAGSITTDRMTANTISGDRIIGSTIHGDKIVANTINGDRIIANTIVGDRIIANTVNGDRIIANTITVEKLNVINGGGNNLLVNSSFENGTAGWLKYDNAGVATLNIIAAGRRGGNCATLFWTTESASIVGLYQQFPGGWKANVTYIHSFYAKGSANLAGHGMSIVSNAPTVNVVWVQNPPLTSGWQRYIAQVSRASDTTDAIFFGIENGAGTTGVSKALDIDDVQFEEGTFASGYSPKADEVLPGTINATMLTADAINGMTITGVTVTGATVRTNEGASRVEMAPAIIGWNSKPALKFYNGANALNGVIQANDGGPGVYQGMSIYALNGNIWLNSGLAGAQLFSFIYADFTQGATIRQALDLNGYSTLVANSSYTYIHNSALDKMMFMTSGGIHSTNGNVDTGYPMHASTFSTFSDETFKTNHSPVVNALDTLDALTVTDYDTPHGGEDIYSMTGEIINHAKVRARGVTAQALQSVAPHLVTVPDEETAALGMSVDIYGLLTTTIAAVQELHAQVKELQDQN